MSALANSWMDVVDYIVGYVLFGYGQQSLQCLLVVGKFFWKSFE